MRELETVPSYGKVVDRRDVSVGVIAVNGLGAVLERFHGDPAQVIVGIGDQDMARAVQDLRQSGVGVVGIRFQDTTLIRLLRDPPFGIILIADRLAAGIGDVGDFLRGVVRVGRRSIGVRAREDVAVGIIGIGKRRAIGIGHLRGLPVGIQRVTGHRTVASGDLVELAGRVIGVLSLRAIRERQGCQVGVGIVGLGDGVAVAVGQSRSRGLRNRR